MISVPRTPDLIRHGAECPCDPRPSLLKGRAKANRERNTAGHDRAPDAIQLAPAELQKPGLPVDNVNLANAIGMNVRVVAKVDELRPVVQCCLPVHLLAQVGISDYQRRTNFALAVPHQNSGDNPHRYLTRAHRYEARR